MTAMRGMDAARGADSLLRRRLTSRSDVKGAQRPSHSQHRTPMRGGRA